MWPFRFCFVFPMSCPANISKGWKANQEHSSLGGNKAAHMTPESIQTPGHQVLSIQSVTKAEIKAHHYMIQASWHLSTSKGPQ